ncbi:MAG TPA: pyridoxal phosphate-dependent aminotransferase [Candidatus Manganitrophaceae bacterium]|nr:pyridoxal phosphate-dependent aminotransferase [Candidatus Manganitrophaceae bacterium]
MKFAQRISQIKPSPTMAMAAKAKAMAAKGIEVTDFGLGEPDFNSPDVAREAGIRAIREGYTKYTPPSGSDELKEAIVQKLKNENGLDYEKKEVIVSCGAKHTLYNIAQVLFERGDEVIIPAPYWVSYPDQVLLNDAAPVIVETREEDQFLLTPERLRKAISPRTKALILNSPSNPTGSAYSAKQLEGLAEVLISAPIWIVSDEIYEKFIYDGAVHTSVAALHPDLKRKTLVVNGVSKAYSMTGWRIGYAAGPKEVIEAMGTVQSQSTSNPTSISQKAAAAALLGGASFIKTMVAEFDKRRGLVVERLNRIPGIRCPRPTGGFYVFPNVKGLMGKQAGGYQINNSSDLALFLLEEGRVSTIAGEAFGADGYLRLSYAVSQEILDKGLRQLENAVSKLR